MNKPASSKNNDLKQTDELRPAHWEQRSAQRVMEVGQDQILERSRKIVEAAYDLLDEAGLEGLTIRAVLTRTGLSRRAFYERFEGKDDLVLAVFEETIRKAVRFFTERVASMENPLDRLRLIVTFIVLGRGIQGEAYTDRRGAALSREHLRLAESRPADLKGALQPLIALIEQILADGMASGVVRQDDPQRLATLLYNLVSTTVHSELLTSENGQVDQATKKQLANDIWEFCRRAISENP
ncbi:TetR/AcrR family transcriptional regulator [Ketobacter sp.]|uniref:TetR/AcrR family transcriptional regulator n=1 Tax=Ketobacter sp. TaxID=2083498 RepID=UPI0025C11650|nr:TetR/AcrR family transcriptional regulator [Ketobacter sp.]